MKTKKVLFALLVPLAVGIPLPSLAFAFPSEGFSQREADIFDDWGISRTRHKGVDGFLGLTATDMKPMVVKESLGENEDLAWQLGEEFALKYPDRHQRAEQIFYYVRDRVDYTSDHDQFGLDEFAINADEVAEAILDNGVAEGDCEDMSALLAVMYKAAGYRSAIALMPGHVATLVYLPEYRRATRMISVAGEEGWVWAEATMETNPLGWVPESVARKGLTVKEVIASPLQRQEAFKTQLEPEDGPLTTRVQRGLPRRGATTCLMTEYVVLASAVGLLLAIVGGWSLAYRLGKRW